MRTKNTLIATAATLLVVFLISGSAMATYQPPPVDGGGSGLTNKKKKTTKKKEKAQHNRTTVLLGGLQGRTVTIVAPPGCFFETVDGNQAQPPGSGWFQWNDVKPDGTVFAKYWVRLVCPPPSTQPAGEGESGTGGNAGTEGSEGSDTTPKPK